MPFFKADFKQILIVMAIITAKAQAEQAKQEAITTEEKGKAAVIKAKFEKEQIRRGEGDAGYKKLVMSTDGVLAQKLKAWVRVNQRYAEAIGKQKWVPEIQMSANSTGKGNSANDLLSLFLAKTAKDINLDMHVLNNN